MKIDLKFDSGWKRFGRAVDPARFKRQLKANIAAANARNGAAGKKLVRQAIKAATFDNNAPLTAFIKGSTKPLVDRGDLWQAVTMKQPSWDTVFIGILQSDGASNIAELLHEGGTIRVTDKMRAMFLALHLAGEGKLDPSKLTGRAAELWARRPARGWLPIAEGTSTIKIPPRPFIREPLSNPSFAALVRANWEQALAKTFADLAQKG